MAKKTSTAAGDSSAFRDEYLASSYPSSFSSSSLRDGDGNLTASFSAAANPPRNKNENPIMPPLRTILARYNCAILESRDNEGYNCAVLNNSRRSEDDDEDGRDGRGLRLAPPPPAPPPTTATSTTAAAAAATTAVDPLRRILVGYNCNSRGGGGGFVRGLGGEINRDRHTPPPPPPSSKGMKKEEGVEVTVETYSASPLMRRSHERSMERMSFMEDVRRTEATMIPATRGKFAKEEEEEEKKRKLDQEQQQERRESEERNEKKKAEEEGQPRPRSIRMKKLWDFGCPEQQQQQQQQQRPPQADTWKDGVTDDGVSADDRYCDLNYYNSGNNDKYDDDDDDDDYDGSTLSSSRIRRESRKILTRQARDDILKVERFASEMRGRMENLRLRQRERETREGGGNDDGRMRREREWEDRDRERERTSSISSTATAAAGTTSTAAPRARRREQEEGAGGDDIESLVRGLHKTVAALSPPTVRGGGADGGSKIASGGNRDIGDGAIDPGDGAGLRRFQQSWRGGEEEGERKKQDGGGGRGYSDGPSNSIYTTTESSSKSMPSGIDLGRRWGEHTKEEKGGVGGDASNERNVSVSGGNSSGMDDRLEHWWKLQKLRKHQEQLKPVFEELAGEPTVAEVDSSGLTMTRIRQEQHRMHRRCISDAVPSPPLTTASSSPWQKGGISDATANTHPSSTITAKTASPGHESSRSSRWRGLQQSKSVLDDSNNILRDNIFLPSLASKSPGSGSIASSSSSRSHPEKYADRRSSVTAVTPERHKNAATISPIKRNSDRTTYDIICSYNDTNRDGRLPPPQPMKTASRTSPLPITGTAVTGYQHRSENATNHDHCAHVTRINPPLASTRMSASSPVSLSAPADGYCNVDDGNKNEKIINDASNSDQVADGSTLSILLQRIEETKSSFTRALLEGSLEEQTKMANLMTTLGEAAVTLRKLETSKEMRERGMR